MPIQHKQYPYDSSPDEVAMLQLTPSMERVVQEHYPQSIPHMVPLDRGIPSQGGPGAQGLPTDPLFNSMDERLGAIQDDQSRQRLLEDQLIKSRFASMADAQGSGGLDLSGAWQGAKDIGSQGLDLLSQGINAITPSQDTINNIAMRLQNAHAIGTGQLPMYLQMQMAQQQMGQNQDAMGMKRQQLSQQLEEQRQKQIQHLDDQVLGIWKDTTMPMAMKKKITQQFAQKGSALAGNLNRLGDEHLVAELEVLKPFLPPGKMEHLQQLMSTPNADLDQVEHWANYAREKKKVVGERTHKAERLAGLQQMFQDGTMTSGSHEAIEFNQLLDEQIKEQNAMAEMKMKMEQLGIKTQREKLDLQAEQVMSRYGPEVHTAGGKVTRQEFIPQTGQLNTIVGDKPPSSVTNLDMRQESAFEKKLGDKNAERIDDTRVKAQDSATIIRNIHEGRKLLDSGMITGVGAEWRTKFGQALQQIGFSKEQDAVKNTQAYGALIAANVAKHIKEFGAGTGLSDADREYAMKMAGGDISFDEKSVRDVLRINEEMARNFIRNHNKSVKGIKSVIPLIVEEPGEYVAPPKKQKKSDSQITPFNDPGKEQRYQEWKRNQGK